ncbi:Kinase superfamily with octicosapeptide Phox Bem1p domain isoform 1 [Olea europaea subsp. europaea]|uniref:Kinase superfamily with octicosapeptide Phox Bem1p domain isoform 1 n=2 Tax=Olea europaea subsp. europaea TaxID=158383 RepID=A0A8S0S023_OLEEU|nr:Kinase superfamily with octicosapeptide Phox Bem1p domain isoform 1 [Olea europaea subsp. europaea]
MAFDQNSMLKELRPLNMPRTVPEDPRIVPGTSSGRPIDGFCDVGSGPESAPVVYYTAAVSETEFIPVRAVPGVTGWVSHTAPPQLGGAGINSTSGYVYSPPFRMPSGGSSDQASDEGSEESVTGQKVKFLCSYGGKILPRPIDGALRYVGGQTRVISVRRDVSFSELVRKVDTYGQNLVIKYQLPEEDLDALVSVSCPDDLENMMDEYEKLVKRSSDGSGKLRLFTFLPSEVESSGIVHVGDLQVGGQSYVEAVNGIIDGFSSSGGVNSLIARKESTDSASSTQNSDIGGTEGTNSLGHGHGEVTFSPSTSGLLVAGNYTVSRETSPRTAFVDLSPSVHVDTSAAPSVPLTDLQPQVAYDMQQLGVLFPTSSPYAQTYVDPCKEASNHADHAQLPSHRGFPAQIFGAVGPVLAHQHIPAAALPDQFLTAVQVTTNPSLVSMKTNSRSPIVQPQQVHLENCPTESAPGLVQLPTQQGYNLFNAQVPTALPGEVYGWQQVPHSEKVVLVEGRLSSQPVLVSGKLPVLKDCYMCQKALPHAHSDTVAQNRKEGSPTTLSDSRSICKSLRMDHRGLVVGTQPRGMGYADHEAGKFQAEGIGFSHNVDKHYGNDRIALQKAQNSENSSISVPQGMMVTTGIQSPYGLFAANIPQLSQDNAVKQVVVTPQHQVIYNATMNRQVNDDVSPVGGMPLQDYSVKVPGSITKEDSTSTTLNHLRQIDGRLENLLRHPSRKEDVLEKRSQQVARSGIPNIPNLPSAESYESTEPPLLGNPNLYPHSNLGINHLALHEISSGKSVYSGVESDPATERTPPIGEWEEDTATWSQPRISGDVEVGTHGGNRPLAASPDVPDNSNYDASFQPAGNLNKDLYLEHVISNKDEMSKQEHQAVVEGVDASVLHSFAPSNPDLLVHAGTQFASTQEKSDVQSTSTEAQQKDIFEEINTNLSEKISLWSPVSDSIGRLQIIKDSDLEELRELGSGTFGTVYHGKWRGTDVAIKRISDRLFFGKTSEQERMIDDFWNEAIKLADLHHPNVVAFYGVVSDGPDGSVATVTEYMVNGSLRNALQKSERILDKRKRVMIVMDVAFGMEYLHGRNIVHFDLKSDNLLVNLRDSHRPICKVGDLGLSKAKCHTLISGGVRGTLPWMAPELLNGSSSLVSEKVDVFSFGMVMWELLTGEEPYADLHYGAIIGGIVSNTLRPPVPDSCSPDWRSLMERCWSSEPSERPCFTEIANELRSMAAQLPLKGQVLQPLPWTK